MVGSTKNIHFKVQKPVAAEAFLFGFGYLSKAHVEMKG